MLILATCPIALLMDYVCDQPDYHCDSVVVMETLGQVESQLELLKFDTPVSKPRPFDVHALNIELLRRAIGFPPRAKPRFRLKPWHKCETVDY